MDDLPTLLYRALATRYGIIVSCSNLSVLRGRLYKARADLQDPDLDRLQFRPDPTAQNSELWIIKGEDPHKHQKEEDAPDGTESRTA